ncbi:ABC transporter permease [Actinoplanes cyaneus]|uniref:ABC transporter permease n=1 Tax=Actinoplanes cyaneus TaxID=52696 RepID=UPI001943A2A3|nr:ABC transporter permease subunit [Actinoplanes cyaneus]MCW2136193.1 ABC-type nitrate/sulfonate/bicarbonate transport system, permease component [Actinoplanes cyaneus]
MKRLLGLLVAALLLLVWEVAGRTGDTGLFPPVSDAIAELASIDPWTDVLPSAGRALAGFAIGVTLGALLGVTIGWLRGLEPWVRPALEFLRAVPPPAVLPVAVLALGATSGMRITVIAAAAMWPVLIAGVDATRAVEPGYLDVARISHARPVSVILPAVLPALIAGARIALGIALIMMVISEMTAATSGLGYLILQAQRTYAIAQMYAGIIVLGLLGWLVTAVFSLVERHVLSWYEDQKGIAGG